jgi:transposase-like protein
VGYQWTIRLFFALVQLYTPEINKPMRPHLKLAGASYHLDETYIKVSKQWKYLYRALDKEGNTIEFMRESETRYSRSQTVLQENDASRPPLASVLHLGG